MENSYATDSQIQCSLLTVHSPMAVHHVCDEICRYEKWYNDNNNKIIIKMNWDTAYMRNFLSRNGLYRIELGLIEFYRVQSACTESGPHIVVIDVVVQIAIYAIETKALSANVECREKVHTHTYIVDSFTIRKWEMIRVCEATAAAQKNIVALKEHFASIVQTVTKSFEYSLRNFGRKESREIGNIFCVMAWYGASHCQRVKM